MTTMCERCGGTGYYVLDVPMSHPKFGQALLCPCQAERVNASRQRKLEALDGLTERERDHRFANTVPHPAQAGLAQRLHAATLGIFTLQGQPGTGKSHYLHCVVNEAREQQRVAVYAAMPDVLDYLRAAFNPKNEEPYEERWHLLITCDVLCLDELDEYHATGWAHERFLRLVDERWRRREETLTVVALNGAIEMLPGKVASRLLQGRVLKVAGVDMRQVIKAQEMVAA